MAFSHGTPNSIVTDGLVFCIDPANISSYPRTGATVTDIIGDITGTLNGTSGDNNTPQWENVNGGIFDFDGTDDYTQLSSPLSLTNTSFSIEAWIKWDGSESRKVFFGHMEAHTNKKSIHWRIYSNGLLRFDFYNSSINSPTGAIVADTWYHLFITYDYSSSTCICYKNGEVLMQGSIGPYIGSQSSSNSYLGSWTPGGEPFPGKMVIFKQYNKVLTQAEVLQNYNALKNRFRT